MGCAILAGESALITAMMIMISLIHNLNAMVAVTVTVIMPQCLSAPGRWHSSSSSSHSDSACVRRAGTDSDAAATAAGLGDPVPEQARPRLGAPVTRRTDCLRSENWTHAGLGERGLRGCIGRDEEPDRPVEEKLHAQHSATKCPKHSATQAGTQLHGTRICG